MVLSSLSEIVQYIDEVPVNKWDDWSILSAVQREIDMRYAVISARNQDNFIDLAGLKSQTVQDALECIQKEMYELAPWFLNLSANYQSHLFNTFPQYYSKRQMNLDDSHSIERLIVEGTIPFEAQSGQYNSVSCYNTFLKNVCYWLEKFRYKNACPYTFTLSTYSRDWEYTEEDGQISADYTTPSPDNWDIWDMANENTGDFRPKEWKLSTGISADNNGQQTSGIQVEIFQWFRTRYLNNPLSGEEWNGYPAGDNVEHAEGMPYGKEPPWKTIDPSEITAAWSQYEWELDDPNVPLRHIPYDLSDWTCKVRLSTIVGNSWEALEKGWDSSLSTQWEANLSAGWDKVMTNFQKSHWGTVYLSAFPVTGLTGKVVGIPTLSASPEACQDFFPDNGHRMNYTLAIDHDSQIYEQWNPSYWDANRKIDTKQRESKHIIVHKEKMPFEVTVENPTPYKADGYVVFYPEHLAAGYDPKEITERTINDTIKFRQAEIASVPPEQRGLLVEFETDWNTDSGVSSYNTLSYRVTDPLTYQIETLHHYDFSWPGLSGSSKTTDRGTQKNWNIPHDQYYLIDEWDLSSGGPAGFSYNFYGNEPYYPDSFGLYQENGDADSETSSSVAMQFLPTKSFEPYSHDTIWSHMSSDTPPIDFNIEDIANKELEGPYYPGVYNDVIYRQTSEMRVFTFFDFSEAFNLDKELE